MTQESTPLTLLALKIAPAFKRAGKPPPTYAQCYRRVLDGTIPAEKRGREWHVTDANVATAKRVLGLTSAA